MSVSKVMVFMPTYETRPGGPDAIMAATERSLAALLAHSKDAGIDASVVIGRFNPYAAGNLENVLEQYKRARALFLESDCTHILFFEHDVIAPANGLKRLLALNVPVAYGVYKFRRATPILNVCRHVKAMYPDSSVSLFPEELAKAEKMGIYPCSGAGFGFTLIGRNVLERLEMRRSPIGGHPCPDMPFAADCMANDIEQVADFGVLCGHVKPDGEVLWPLPLDEYGSTDIGSMGVGSMAKVKVLILEAFNGDDGGVNRSFSEGEKTEIEKGNADEYQRAGFLQILEVEPAVKVVKPPAKKKTARRRKPAVKKDK